MKFNNLCDISKNQSNYIKIIAIFTMFIDHLGVIIYPDLIIYRIIGRIAFPLFAFQLCVGYLHSKNIANHLLKIFVFAIIIQIGYYLAGIYFNVIEDTKIFNIFFTLLLGLLSIYFYDTKKYILMLLVLLIPFATEYSLGVFIEYQSFGVVLILTMFILRKNTIAFIISTILLTFVCSLLLNNYLQMFSIFALIFIFKPIDFNVNLPNNVFYYFYPLHLIFIYLLSFII